MAGMAGDGDVLRALAGGAWARKLYWPPQGPPTTAWDGVEEVVNGRVTKLGLSSEGLTGSIPPELGRLADLKELSLYGNQLSGSIPSELGQLQKLEFLWLANNQLSGSIPPELCQLQKLESLWLGDNQLTGSIPKELGNLTNLTELGLHKNQLTGAVPYQLDQLAMLSGFACDGNLDGAPAGSLETREKVQQWQLTLANRRLQAEAGSEFFKALASFAEMSHVAILLDRLCPLVSSIPELQLFLTLVCAAARKGMLEDVYRNGYIRRVLELSADKVPTTSANISLFKVALDMAMELGAIDLVKKYELDNKAEVKRMEHAPFVKDMRECIWTNAVAIHTLGVWVGHIGGHLDAHGAAIASLGRRVDAHDTAIAATHQALMKFRAAYQKKLQIEATVGVLKLVINAFSFGICGGIIDVGLAAFVNGVVDFSDPGIVARCLRLGTGIGGFSPVVFLQSDGAMSSTDLKQQLFGAVDEYAAAKGDQALDEATRGHVAIKILAVAAASCDPGMLRETLPPPPSDPLPETGSVSDLTPAPMTPEDLAKALARVRLGHLEEQLMEAGFTSLEALKELAEFGKDEFLNVAKEDIGVQKLGERLGLWSIAKAL